MTKRISPLVRASAAAGRRLRSPHPRRRENARRVPARVANRCLRSAHELHALTTSGPDAPPPPPCRHPPPNPSATAAEATAAEALRRIRRRADVAEHAGRSTRRRQPPPNPATARARNSADADAMPANGSDEVQPPRRCPRRRAARAARPGARPMTIAQDTLAHDEAANSRNRQRRSRAVVGFHAVIRRGQRLAVDDADHLVDAGIDAAVEIALLEQRHDRVVDDAAARARR